METSIDSSVDGVEMQVVGGIRSYTSTIPYGKGTARVTVNVLRDLFHPYMGRQTQTPIKTGEKQ